MSEIFGGLIEFDTDEELENFITEMSIDDAISILEKSIEFAHKNNLYSIQETHVIYESLKKLKNSKK